VQEGIKQVGKFLRAWFQSWKLTLFEKAILVNSAMLIIEALAGLWVTSHHVEAQHYLIDTFFIVISALIILFVNIFLLRTSFRPLFHLLATIRTISAENTGTRATVSDPYSEVGELANAFNSMLDRLETARREQTRLILQAQEEEQRRIALELHDDAGQNLTTLLVHIEILNQQLQILDSSSPPEQKERIQAELQQLNKLAQYTLDNLRVLAQQLRPSVLDDLGLLAAFRWLAEENRLQLQVELHIDGMELIAQHLPGPYATALFRIAQESLTNIARHAQTNRAWITLTHDHTTILLQVRDAGCGFQSSKRPGSTGMVGMRTRAASLKGTLTVDSQPSQGTTIEARLPLPALLMQIPATAKEHMYAH
jgi:two-component system sensor histidine kinase UhpB